MRFPFLLLFRRFVFYIFVVVYRAAVVCTQDMRLHTKHETTGEGCIIDDRIGYMIDSYTEHSCIFGFRAHTGEVRRALTVGMRCRLGSVPNRKAM